MLVGCRQEDGRKLSAGEDFGLGFFVVEINLAMRRARSCEWLCRMRPSRAAVFSAVRRGIKMLAIVLSLSRLPCASSSQSQSTNRANRYGLTSTSFRRVEK